MSNGMGGSHCGVHDLQLNMTSEKAIQLSLYEAGSGGVMCDVLLTSEKAIHYIVIYHCIKHRVEA